MSQEKKAITLLVGLITFIVVVYFAFGTKGPSPTRLTKERLSGLKVSVIEYANEKKKLPTTLEELGLNEEAVCDHTGTPFIYKVTGNQVSITSYGADGKPGGHAFKADKTVSFSWPVEE